MSNHTYWVSIGRNVGERPLGQHEWRGFQNAVEALINHIAGAYVITEVAGGCSTYDGVPEDTHLFLVSVPGTEVELLRARLALLLPIYRQDSIGFVGGSGESLIYAT